jgi:formate-dependent nitrite reductase membrane component NrfD
MTFCVTFYYWLKGAPEKMVKRGVIASLIAVIVGIMALVVDLEHPERFYLVFVSPRLNTASWIFIGSALLTVFTISVIAFAMRFKVRMSESLAKVAGYTGFISGIGVAAYTGILIGIAFNVPFWNAPALPLIFMISALSTGLSTLILLIVEMEDEVIDRISHELAKTDGFVMLLELIVLGVFIVIRSYGPIGAIRSVNEILFGSLAAYFVGGVLLMGLAIPIMLTFGYKLRGGTSKHVTLISAIFVLIGGAMLRYVVLEAGILQIPCCP